MYAFRVIVVIICICNIVFTIAKPQYGDDDPTHTSQSSSVHSGSGNGNYNGASNGGGESNNGPSNARVVNIEVPNYNIHEFIQAGFKPSEEGDTKISIFLKRPEQNYEAQTDAPKNFGDQTKVQLQYEQPQKVHVHYPNDKPYAPILPPLQI